MIKLLDCGADGLGMDPLELDESQIASVSVDPARPDEPKSVITMNNGTWFLVMGTVPDIEALIEAAKKNGN